MAVNSTKLLLPSCGVIVVADSIALVFVGVRQSDLATEAKMVLDRHFPKVLLRRPFWVIVVLSGIVSSTTTAEASCGDHLGGSRSDHLALMSKSFPRQTREQPSVPCHGQECRGCPSAPIPVQPPVVLPALRQSFVTPGTLVVIMANGSVPRFLDLDLTRSIGFRQRLERPPQLL